MKDVCRDHEQGIHFPVADRRREQALMDEYFDVPGDMPELIQTDDDEDGHVTEEHTNPTRR